MNWPLLRGHPPTRLDLHGKEGQQTIGVTINQANAPTATGPAGRGVHLGKRLPASSRYPAWPPTRQRPPKASLRGPLVHPAPAGPAPESGQANVPLTREPLGDGRPFLGGPDPQQRHEVQLIGGPAVGATYLATSWPPGQAITRLSWAPSLAGADPDAQLAPDPRLSRPVVMGRCRSVIVAYSTSRDEVMAVVTPASRWHSAAGSPASTLS
jgi:hypothetical protein